MPLLNVSPLLVLVTLFCVSFSLPNGAPISACQTMMPVHQGVSPQPNPSPYIFKVGSSSYQNDNAIQVQILGPDYRGLLLEARTFAQTGLLGTWINPPNNTKILPCPENPKGAITHSNTELKTQYTTYTWIPPSADCPAVVFFIATIAQAREIYWLEVKSAVLWKAATCGAPQVTWRNLLVATLCFQLAMFLISKE